MTTDLVVSAYAADLGWVEDLREKYPDVRVWMYDKDEIPAVGLRWQTPPIRLPNVGKCDHTYLHHIVEHYDDLADWTLFTTDCPHDSVPAGFKMADGLIPQPHAVCPWVCRVRDWDAATGRIRWETFANRPDKNGTNWAERFASGKITPARLSFVDWAKKYVGCDVNRDWPGYHPGAVFAAPKKAITYLPREFYARLRDQLSHSVEPEEGHYMERLWLTVLAGKAKYEEAA